MDTESLLIGLALIVVLGTTAQWLAWRLRLPSILLLLTFGFVAGPILGLIEPAKILGDLLPPIVSISVGLILFEGGLSLRVSELRSIGGVVRNMVTIGAAVTWLLSTVAAHFFLVVDESNTRLSWPLSFLLGAIVVVTGPTVIVPLLRHVRPAGRLESILRWEGIVIDPIGATLAVLVFHAINPTLSGEFGSTESIVAFVATGVVGGATGLTGAMVLYLMLRRFLIPDFLQNPTTLMAVVGVYALADFLHEESGVFATTLMGIALANQRSVAVKHIAEFKENLQVLLISFLFICLSANLELSDLSHFNMGTFLFLVALIIGVRPAMILVSTIRSTLTWKEKVFLAMMAPRGIVAAAVASVFALPLTRLSDTHPELARQAELLTPFVFIVIISTVAFYGLGAPLVARSLGLAVPNPQGTVIVGAHPFARAIANALKATGCRVLLIDTNRANLQSARMEDLETYYGNALTEHALEKLELDGMGRMLALTPNDEVNSLAALHFRETFSRAQIYQLAPAITKDTETVPRHLRGRYLFSQDLTFDAIESRWNAGATIKTTQLTEEFDYAAFCSHYGSSVEPLFVVSENGTVTAMTVMQSPTPTAGQTLLSLTDPNPVDEPLRSAGEATEKPEGG